MGPLVVTNNVCLQKTGGAALQMLHTIHTILYCVAVNCILEAKEKTGAPGRGIIENSLRNNNFQGEKHK